MASRAFSIGLILLFSSVALALEDYSETSLKQLKLKKNPQTLSSWKLEGDMIFHSVAGPSSPWIGFGGTYNLLKPLDFGLRGFLPFAHTVDNASYSAQAFFRYRFSRSSDMNLFLEPSVSENFYNLTPFLSYGLAFGIMAQLNSRISAGISAGLETSTMVVDSVGLEEESNLVIYPKIALVANFNL